MSVLKIEYLQDGPLYHVWLFDGPCLTDLQLAGKVVLQEHGFKILCAAARTTEIQKANRETERAHQA